MIFADAGSSWCKRFARGDDRIEILPTRQMARSDWRFDWGTGHTARHRSDHFENDLISLTRGALALVDEADFTMLDLGSRDSKFVTFDDRRPVKLDWSVGCAAATGATLEMIGRFYEVDDHAIEVGAEWTPVTCGTYALERIMDAVSAGEPVTEAIGRFVHGLARNAHSFTGKPKRLYLSGGFCNSRAFSSALSRYCEVVPMGRFVPLAGLWAFAAERGQVPAELPEALCAPLESEKKRDRVTAP